MSGLNIQILETIKILASYVIMYFIFKTVINIFSKKLN